MLLSLVSFLLFGHLSSSNEVSQMQPPIISSFSSDHSSSTLSPLPVPPMIVFSIYMGRIKYNYFKLTVASMKYNPNITFVLVNIVPDEATYYTHFQQVIRDMHAQNLLSSTVLTITQWKELVFKKLSISVPFTMEWYYKLCDFKPTLGHLFSELVDLPSQKYSYWGYADIDLIWGNFQKFAYLFQGDYYFIRTSAHVTVGMAQFFRLDNFTLHLYEQDPEYLVIIWQ
jgi:hypothetical protein